eukprot:1310718-Rhodomonas_salina.1
MEYPGMCSMKSCSGCGFTHAEIWCAVMKSLRLWQCIQVGGLQKLNSRALGCKRRVHVITPYSSCRKTRRGTGSVRTEFDHRR